MLNMTWLVGSLTNTNVVNTYKTEYKGFQATKIDNINLDSNVIFYLFQFITFTAVAEP